MRKIFRIVHEILRVIWATGILQATARQLFRWLWLLLRWCVAHPGSIPGGLVALWFARLFDTSSMRALMSFADIPMIIYYGIIVGLGVGIGAGLVTFKRPFDHLR